MATSDLRWMSRRSGMVGQSGRCVGKSEERSRKMDADRRDETHQKSHPKKY
jgi:hypothetical protein